MRIYVAGPMSGIPLFNYPAFHMAAAKLRNAGHEVVNPAEIDEDTSKEWHTYLRKDLKELVDCDAVAVLPGWEKSKGASLEVHVARTLGMPVLDADTLEPLGNETILQEAQRLVHGDRGADYGHPIDDYGRTGRMWGAILGIGDIDPRICCLMMVALKISREVNMPKRDNRVDGAGYFECADMVAQRQAEKK